MFCRVQTLHVELEQAVISFAFQHQSAWQDIGRILLTKAELLCFVYELSKSLGVSYDELPKRELLYYAGYLKEGSSQGYRKNLTNGDNIKSLAPDDSNHQIRSTDSFLTHLKQQFR